MARISIKQLENVVNHLNRITGHNEKPYTRVNDRLVASVGTYILDGAYGGWKLCQMANESGGQRDVLSTGYCSKPELYTAIHCYISGLEQTKKTA